MIAFLGFIVEFLRSLFSAKPATPLPENTDGCSGGISSFYRKVLRKAPPWEGCCIDHDKAYRAGGRWRDRLRADLALGRCVWKAGYPSIGVVMFVAVRVFGSPFFPMKSRKFAWGSA
jgi:hypothetical protein